ncbi:MAG TPA: 50S ribosomal protein L4 [Vicinamibacteria bacterium]|nr:50S ribosomal protein L4 [Vicinamibacteria bacterium]
MAEKKDKKAPAVKKAAKAPAGKKAAKAARAQKASKAAEETHPSVAGNASLQVVDAQNKKVGDVALHPEVFATRVNKHLLYEAVKQYRAGGRRGTHATKNRALVSGSGKKPWRQKGTGRARVGETRNPLWRHGGTVFGPQPRSYELDMPKKARMAALRSALTQRVQDGSVKVVERFDIAQPKTKELKQVLDRLEISGKTLLVDSEPADNLILSGRNIPGLKVVDPSYVNVYDLLDCRTVVLTREGLSKLEERLAP